MLGFRIPDADQAMLISGAQSKEGATPFRVVVGHRAWVMPFFSRVAFLTLEQKQARIEERCLTKEKIPVRLTAVCAFKVPNEEQMIVDAAQNFLSDQGQMETLAGQIASGHLRGIAGDMTLDEIITKRQNLAEQVLDASKPEFARQGLQVQSFQITSVDDQGGGAIDALSAPHLAAIRRDAAIAQANADQEAVKAQQIATQQQADYVRETEVKKAGYAAQVAEATATSGAAAQVAQATAEAQIGEANAERDRRQRVAQARADAETGEAAARASQAGPLAQATAQHDVAVAATALAEQQALQRKQELDRDVVKPAEADKAARIAAAEAEAESIRKRAEAAATEGRVSLDQRIVEQLPQIATAISDGLRGSNLTVLNGTEGLSQVATGLIAQVSTIYDAARAIHSHNGRLPESPVDVNEG